MIHQDPAALADKGHVAFLGAYQAFPRQEKGVEFVGPVNAETIGPDKGEGRFAGHCRDLLLKSDLPAFGKSSGNDGGAAHPGLDALRHDAGNVLGPGGDHGVVDLFRDRADLCVDSLVLENTAPGVDRVDLDRVAQQKLVIDDIGRMAVIGQGDPDDGDGFGIEQRVEIQLHCSGFSSPRHFWSKRSAFSMSWAALGWLGLSFKVSFQSLMASSSSSLRKCFTPLR